MRSFRKDYRARTPALTAADITAVLAACAGRPVVRFPALAEQREEPGVALRVDSRRGLTEQAGQLLELAHAHDVPAWFLFPVAMSGDLGHAREGRLIFDPDAIALLGDLRDRLGCDLGFLADPSTIADRVLNSPVFAWNDALRRLESAGIPVAGLGCSFDAGMTAVLDMVWTYRAAGLIDDAVAFPLLSRLDYGSREWLLENLDSLDPVLRTPRDGLASVEVHADGEGEGERKFIRSLNTVAPRVIAARVRARLDALAYTNADGWHLLTADGRGGPATTDDVVRAVRDADRGARIGVIVDAADAAGSTTAAPSRSSGHLRTLPYPFHHYLTVNSDIDWTTDEHLDRSIEHVAGELGLPFAGSAYLLSRDGRYPAWDRLPTPTKGPAFRLGRWAAAQHLDTVHGLAYSFDTIRVPLPDDDEGREAFEFSLPEHADIGSYDGFLLTSDGTPAATPVLELLCGELCLGLDLAETREDRDNSCCYLVYRLPGIPTADAAGPPARLRVRLEPGARVRSLHTLYGDASRVANVLDHLGRNHFHPLLLTAHGGGHGSREFGSCVTRKWDEEYPDEARLALDRAESPFYCLPALRSAGVRFFNQNGNFSIPGLTPIAELLQPEPARDGSTVLVFQRFFSTREDGTEDSSFWTHGKHGATAQGLGANLEDAVQQMHWLEPGHGAIVYTHLGHRVGNQVSGRLGWNDELLRAWATVAEYHFGRDTDDPVPFRIWFAPASAILAYAAVRRGLAEALRVEGSAVSITSWKDEALGCAIPDPAQFGSSWLHGVTVYVADPDAASVEVDSETIDHFTCNPADQLGGPSITLVDASQKTPLLHDAPPHRACGVDFEIADAEGPVQIVCGAEMPADLVRVAIPAASLGNATHWTFEVLLHDTTAQWRIGFETEDGERFLAGNDPAEPWAVTGTSPEVWRRHTLALHECAHAQRPRGRICALLVQRIPGDEDARAAPLLFRDVCVIQPAPGTPRAATRILAGRAVYQPDARSAAGIEIRCSAPGVELQTRTDDDGHYLFRELPVSARCAVSVADEHAHVHFGRGSVAHLTRDHWDWDVALWEPAR